MALSVRRRALGVSSFVGLVLLGASCTDRGGQAAPADGGDASATEAGNGALDAASPPDAALDAASRPDAALDAALDAASTTDAADASSDARVDAGPCGGKGTCGGSGSSTVISTACGFDVNTQPELCDAFCRLENPGSASAHCLSAGEFGQFLCSCL